MKGWGIIRDENGEELAIIVRSDCGEEPVEHVKFFSRENDELQLGFIKRFAGVRMTRHTHNEVKREISHTSEAIFIRKGKLRLEVFNDRKAYVGGYTLEAGDVVLLLRGGHGFRVIEDVEMYEVKQGPYAGENDKTYF